MAELDTDLYGGLSLLFFSFLQYGWLTRQRPLRRRRQ